MTSRHCATPNLPFPPRQQVQRVEVQRVTMQLTTSFLGTTFKTAMARGPTAPSPNATRQVTCMAKKKVGEGGGGRRRWCAVGG